MRSSVELASALVEILKQKNSHGTLIRSLNGHMDELPWKLW
jgi:hypothetical protein